MARASLLCWNLAGKVRRLGEQAERVIGSGADLVCLQEVRPSARPAWEELLTANGWPYLRVADATAGHQAGRRPLSVLTASRQPLEEVELEGLPWPERALAVHVDGLELINLHSPISPSPRLAKVITHEAIHEHLRSSQGARALCGDLNTPRREHPDGRVWTFARDRYGRLRPDRGERWDQAELGLIRGLEAHGFRDAFRELHGPEARELSWEWPRWGGGYRLDHLIVSAEVTPLRAGYLHDWRTAGLSDHSALSAELAWGLVRDGSQLPGADGRP